MREVDIAWAAGLYEGEGTFIIEKTKTGRQNIRCSITMADRDVIDRVAKLFNRAHKVRAERPRKGAKAHHKPLYCFPSTGHPAVRVMQTILPYMGERRTKRILEVLAAWKSVPRTREKRVPPSCHPDRKHYARGFCLDCYRLIKNTQQRRRYHESNSADGIRIRRCA